MTEYASGRLRDEIDAGDLDDLLHRHAGLTVEDLPSFMAEFYDPSTLDLEHIPDEKVPDHVTQTVAYQSYTRTATTSEVSAAVSADPSTKVEHITGVPESDSLDWSGLSSSQQVRELINLESNFTANIYGKRDDGKTTFATSFVPEWLSECDGVIVSNYTGDWVDHHVSSFPEFRSLCLGDEEYFHSSFESGTPPELPRELPKFWFFDESSTWLDWRQYKNEIMEYYVPWLNRFAKYNIEAVHLFHSFASAAKELRRSEVVPLHIHKYVTDDGEHRAHIYREMNDSPVQPKHDSELYTIENIPKSPLDVDPDLPAPWSWE